jgi:hypothetical protein
MSRARVGAHLRPLLLFYAFIAFALQGDIGG